MLSATKANQLEIAKARKALLKTKFTKMSSASLLRKVSLGKMDNQEATVSATIIARRFPNPPGISNYRPIVKIAVGENLYR